MTISDLTFPKFIAYLFMQWIQWPEWTTGNLILYISFLLITPLLGLSEFKGWSTLKYSKFRSERGMSSRTGMFVLYFIPVLMHVLAYSLYEYRWSIPQICLSACILIHFSKRSAESLFLHKYAGPIDRLTVFQIAFFYSGVSWAAAYFNQLTPMNTDLIFVLGCVFFMIGIIGNFLHHKYLADLRKISSAYFIPQKGLFRLVSCPHYLFEIMIWLGMAMMCKQPFMYLTFISMTFYLMARSVKAQNWYRNHFDDYPAERKAMIPYLF